MKNTTKKSKIFPILFTILTLILLSLIGVVLYSLGVFKNNNSIPIPKDTEVNGINISNLSRAEAVNAVNSYLKKKTDNFTLTLQHNDKIYILDKDDYTINDDIHTIIDMASNTSDYKKALESMNYFQTHGNSTIVSFNYIFQGLDEKINKICEDVETPPIDSQIVFNPDSDNMFEITESKCGLLIDREKLYEDINTQFQKTNTVLVNLNLEEAEPNITESDNEKMTKLVSSFSTNVSDSTGGRKKNVKLALSKFNGMVIKPNESVSFNETTRPHTLENGYEIATIILNGRFADGVGGGICQASTTLYNALIEAGIQIDEVHKHTLPVFYVPLALDAMVTDGGADLKFTNNTDSTLFIKTYSTANDVTVEIYSKPNIDGFEYKTRSEKIKTIPAPEDKIVPDTNKEHTDKVIFKGEKHRLSYGKEGYEANSYLQTWKDGKLINEKKLRHEVYQPQTGIIIEGTYEPLEDMPIIEN